MREIYFKRYFYKLLALVVIGFTLNGCTTSQNLMSPLSIKSKKPNIALKQFQDIPIPSSAEINVDKTLVFGTDGWIGQLAVTADQDPSTLYNFFRKNLPNHQWREITAIRAPTSVLAYEREDRVLTMQITSINFGGSDILLTMSPKDNASVPRDG